MLRSSRLAASSASASSAVSAASAIKTVTVVGAGLMGSGIAQIAAASGAYKVKMVDVAPGAAAAGRARIETSLKRVAKKNFAAESNPDAAADAYVAETMSRLETGSDIVALSQGSDLVIEAIVENMDIKRKLFSQLDNACPQNTIFASNTSSLSCSEMARATKRPDRFGGLHFFNPVPVMKLLEVVRAEHTSDATFDAMMHFGKTVGKHTVACKDTPGFIVNRLLVPYMFEAVRMLERGDASMEDIDAAMKLGAGYPMGPFQLFDYVGLDTTKFVMEGWHKAHPDEALFKPSPMLNKLVAEGKLGNKTGEGFYVHKK